PVVRRAEHTYTLVVLERGVVLTGPDPDRVIGRVDRDRADRDRGGRLVEDGRPVSAPVRRLPHASIGSTGVDLLPAGPRHHREPGHATAHVAGATARVRDVRIAVVVVCGVVVGLLELCPRTP